MEKLQNALNEFCQENTITRFLFPFGMIIMFIGSGLGLCAELPFLSDLFWIGSFSMIWRTLFYIGALLVFAKADYKMLSIGFLIRCITLVIIMVSGRWAFLYFVYYIIAILWTGYISYTTYKKI